MACMEHQCRRCNWSQFDNDRFTSCPDHPGETSHFFDEQYDRDDCYNPMNDDDIEWGDDNGPITD